jgi:hypothetical protein
MWRTLDNAAQRRRKKRPRRQRVGMDLIRAGALQPKEIGGELTSNPIVRKLTFTGSTEVGKLLMEQCVGTVKKRSLELGGNAPFIVFDDADIEMAFKSLPLRRQGVPSPRNTGMPARPASAPTASWCRTASMTPLPSASPRPPGR